MKVQGIVKVVVSILGTVSLNFASYISYHYIVFSPVKTGFPGEKNYYGGYIVAKTDTYNSALYIAEDVQARIHKPVYVIKNSDNLPLYLYYAYKKACIEKFMNMDLSTYPDFNQKLFKQNLADILKNYKDIKVHASCNNITTLQDFTKLLSNGGEEGKIKKNLKSYFKILNKGGLL